MFNLALKTCVIAVLGVVFNGASACSFVRLDGSNGPFYKTRATNQGTAAFCEIIASSHLINAEIFLRDGKRDQTSPFALAFEYAKEFGEVGSTFIQTLQGQTTCTAESVERVVRGAGAINQCQEVAASAANMIGTKIFARSSPCAAELQGDGFAPFKRRIAQIFGIRADEKISSNGRCGSVINIGLLPVAYRVSGYKFEQAIRIPRHQQAINASLDGKPQRPVAVRFCAKVLRDPSTDAVDPVSGKSGIARCGEQLHVAVIIGRRSKNNECEYLILNSWGDCTDATYSPKYECERGKIWVTADDLLRNVVGVTSLSPQFKDFGGYVD